MKKITLISTALLLSLNIIAQAPNWAWAKSFGTANVDGYSIANDAAGNIYVTGYFNSLTITFGAFTFTNHGWADMFLVKYDASGNVLWAKSAGGTYDDFGNALTVDAAGNVYVVGFFKSPTIVFDSDTLTNSVVTGNNKDMYVVKYDTNGNVLWANRAGGILDDIATAVTTDATGNVYMAGYYGSTSIVFGTTTLANASANADDISLVKYDSNGNVIWAKRAGGALNDHPNFLKADASGNVYMAGSFGSQSIVFGSTTFNLVGNGDMFFVKYNSSGSVLWAKKAANIFDDIPNSIDIDASGNVYVCGYTDSGSLVFGTTTLTNTVSNGSAYMLFVVKYDSSGNVLWAKTAGGTSSSKAYSIKVDPSGDIYITGFYGNHPIIFGTDTLSSQGIFLAKYNASGNVLWALGTVSSWGGDYGNSVTTDATGNVYITGYYGSATVAFDTTTLTLVGTNNMFVAKVNGTPLSVWPGDADNNHNVDNADLLPIGLYYGQTGIARTVQGNVWQADSCANWGMQQSNGFDIKHADCNGDSTIDANDTLAINLNFNLTHAITTPNIINQERTASPDIYFVTSSNYYNAGDMVDVEVWAGSSTTPVSNLYGLAFNIHYDASLVQSGTENLTYPSSWLGTPGTDVIKIGKVDALATTAYAAETRINHTNASGFGKIADFKFQVNTSLSTAAHLHFSISNYKANDSAGVAKQFNTINDSLLLNSTVGVNENTLDNSISISPNPFTSQTTITFSSEQKNTTLKIMDVVGKEIKNDKLLIINGRTATLDMAGYAKGVYIIRIEDEKKNVVNRKVVLQ